MRRVLAPHDELFTGTLETFADIYQQTGRTILPPGDARTKNAMKVLLAIYRSLDLDEEAAKLDNKLQDLPDAAPESK